MEDKIEERPWYESKSLRDKMNGGKGRSPIGMHVDFLTGHIFHGVRALRQINYYLEPKLTKEKRRVLIITDDFTKKFAKSVINTLENIEAESLVWAGVEPEVPLTTIDEGAKICEEFKPKVFVAIGGGSVMDTAKAIMVRYEKPEMNFYSILPYTKLGLRKKVKYLIVIPTTSGTGSDITQSAMLIDMSKEPPQKIALVNTELVPDLIILHIDFVKNMPPFLTMATGLDAFTHSLGSYVSAWTSPLTDALNIYAIKEILKYLPRAYKYGGKDLEARSHMQLASTMAGLGFGNSLVGQDHAFAHSFGAVFNVHHGITVAMFLPYTIAFQSKISDRWKDLCFLFNIESQGKSDKVLFSEFLGAVKNFITSFGAPVCIKDLKNPVISKEEYYKNLDILIDYTEVDSVSGLAPRYINREIIRKIYEYAWDGKDIDF